MRILFGIQLTGNGHINRSLRLIYELRKLGHTVDICVSGSGASINSVEYQYRFRGYSIYPNNSGGVNWIKTIFKTNPIKVIIDSIKLKTSKYDLVVSDFEPVSVLSSFLHSTKCITICNQNEILNKRFNIFRKLFIKIFTLRSKRLSYSYNPENQDSYLPIISEKVCNGQSYDAGFNLVYLPYLDTNRIYKEIVKYGKGNWKIYTKDVIKSEFKNIKICKTDTTTFTKDLLSCRGIITASGFSTTSEALILGKKLWSIPLKGQFEQKFNSGELSKFGIFNLHFNSENIKLWIDKYTSIHYKWSDPTWDIIKKIELYAEN